MEEVVNVNVPAEGFVFTSIATPDLYHWYFKLVPTATHVRLKEAPEHTTMSDGGVTIVTGVMTLSNAVRLLLDAHPEVTLQNIFLLSVAVKEIDEVLPNLTKVDASYQLYEGEEPVTK
jgi:hypothetical protein